MMLMYFVLGTFYFDAISKYKVQSTKIVFTDYGFSS